MKRRKVFEKCGKTKLLRIRGKGGGESLFFNFFEKQEAGPLALKILIASREEGSETLLFCVVVADPLTQYTTSFFYFTQLQLMCVCVVAD